MHFTVIGPNLDNAFQNLSSGSQPFCVLFPIHRAKNVERFIYTMKLKNSTGYDTISSKLLEGIGDKIYRHISILINQSLLTGIFPDELKLSVISLIKNTITRTSVATVIFLGCRQFKRYLKRLLSNSSLYDYFTSQGLCLTVNTDFVVIIPKS